ncbi:MAG: hypothetical protein II947_07325 [Bacteroidaceae bacterium]|nr:hypothetical protein [Bacteroidaceae bacterium]MBQ3628818.1 hypothetical protein [Bacteroidaceae bacterium]
MRKCKKESTQPLCEDGDALTLFAELSFFIPFIDDVVLPYFGCKDRELKMKNEKVKIKNEELELNSLSLPT